MKTTDKLKELRGMNAEELKSSIASTEQELLNLRFRHAAGQLEQTAQLKQLKRSIARIKTVLNEKQNAATANL
jgi:large subunit ribosomal protein L29